MQLLTESGASVSSARTAAEMDPLVPTVDLGDRGACVSLLYLLHKIFWQLLLW